MKDLNSVRNEIEEIDKAIAQLFEKRMMCVRDVAEYKKEHALPVKDAAREAALLDKNRGFIEDPEILEYYVRLEKSLISLSCDYQNRLISGMRVAYCGVEGAFAYIAAKKLYPASTLVSCKSFEDAYRAVENGECDCCVLPLENSYAGEIDTVADLLFTGSLFVNQVINLPIEQCLVAKPGTALDTIKTVISHEQALKQCSDYIKNAGFKTEEATNTALAAKTAAESGDASLAAIASACTAELYGLTVLEHNINDSRNNMTRFASFSRVQNLTQKSKMRENESFILVFTVQNRAGALAQTLNIIGAHGYNMKSLRSRPMKGLEWQYFFFIEAEGNVDNENGRALLSELSAICARLRLAGTYYTV